MRFDVVTLFPEFFPGPLATGLVGKALAAGRATVETIDPRRFTHDRHRTVDDTPYGGGGGMVMKPEPVSAAIDLARQQGPGSVILLSPQGRPLRQADFVRWAASGHLVLVAGRYEGFDERIRRRVDEEISLGDFVLTGGEYGALTIIDGVARLLPGTLGNKDCPEQDSFSDGLLEYPHYTRPERFENDAVPDVLQSGHHQRLTEWRHAQSLLRTRARRPDLLRRRGLNPDEAAVLRPVQSPPILVALPASVLSAEVLAVTVAFGVERVFVVAGDVPPDEVRARLECVPQATYPVREGPRSRRLRRAPPAIVEADLTAAVTVVGGWSELPPTWRARPVERLGAERCPPLDAVFADPGAFCPPTKEGTVPCLLLDAPAEVVERHLPVIRGSTAANRLPAAAALGIYLDRVVGEG